MKSTVCWISVPYADSRAISVDHTWGVDPSHSAKLFNGKKVDGLAFDKEAFDKWFRDKEFDQLFGGVRNVVFRETDKDGDPEKNAGIILVRVEGIPAEDPKVSFKEPTGDRFVKELMEKCLHLPIGPFMYMSFPVWYLGCTRMPSTE